MTDLNERLAALLNGEPPAPHDLDRVMSNGRRALRRRSALTAVAGVAGTAAVTTAIVVPITSANGGATSEIKVVARPHASTSPHCKLYYVKVGDKAGGQRITHFIKKHHDAASIIGGQVNGSAQSLEVCPSGVPQNSEAAQQTEPPDPTATMPRYNYTEEPQAIAARFGDHLSRTVKDLGFEVAYTRPFAQESAALEKGHPAYYGGNVDVRLPDGLADIGVQVTHGVTELVPFDGDCDPDTCTRSTLPDGSLVQISRIDAGSGGAEVVTVDIHHPDGLVVSAQMSNYGFGPDATRDRTKHQPLTIKQLTELAKDAAWTF